MVNARSLKSKKHDLSEYLITREMDLCLVTETWLKLDDTDVILKDIAPEGYGILSSPRTSGKRGGGLAVIFRENKLVMKQTRMDLNSCECTKFAVTSNSGSKLLLVLFYRPPDTSVLDFTNDFLTVVESCVETSSPTFYLGDMTIRIDIDDDPNVILMNDLLDTLGFSNQVFFTTHRDGHILDLLICDSRDERILSDLCEGPYFSDHRFVNFKFALESGKLIKDPQPLMCRKLKAINQDALAEYLSKRLTEVDMSIIENYNMVLRDALDEFAPLKKRLVKKDNLCPWMTNRVRDMIGLRRSKE